VIRQASRELRNGRLGARFMVEIWSLIGYSIASSGPPAPQGTSRSSLGKSMVTRASEREKAATGKLCRALLTAVLFGGALISGQAAHGAEPASPAPSLPPPAVWRPGVLVRGADGSIGLDAGAKQREVRVCPLSRDRACGYAGLSAVFGSLRPGDRVVMAPGEYREAAILRVDRITIVAEDGAHLLGVAAGGKAALVIAGNDTVIEGLECSDIAVPDRNGACIRLEGRNLTLRGVHFHDSEQGILGGGGTVLIEDSTFERLGKGGRTPSTSIEASS
jgi:hypothetical protein